MISQRRVTRRSVRKARRLQRNDEILTAQLEERRPTRAHVGRWLLALPSVKEHSQVDITHQSRNADRCALQCSPRPTSLTRWKRPHEARRPPPMPPPVMPLVMPPPHSWYSRMRDSKLQHASVPSHRPSEILFASSANESLNLALIGAAHDCSATSSLERDSEEEKGFTVTRLLVDHPEIQTDRIAPTPHCSYRCCLCTSGISQLQWHWQ